MLFPSPLPTQQSPLPSACMHMLREREREGGGGRKGGREGGEEGREKGRERKRESESIHCINGQNGLRKVQFFIPGRF